jgi:DNA-binding GntR family transcriptional regulator
VSSVVDQVAAGLREAILEGALPPGTRLREVELAREHGAARHSVRAALRALAAERLVTLERHRGAHVAVLDGPAGRALYELRTGLEVEAARLALARHGGRLPAAVHRAADRLAAACARRNARWADVSRAHGALHGAIVAAAESPRIADAHAALAAETRLFLLNVPRHWSLPALAEDHRRLVAGLEKRGPDALREHLDASAALLLEDGASPVRAASGGQV